MKIIEVINECFQEYENEIALGLFCSACNLRCPFCFNLDRVTDPKQIIGEAKELFWKHINPMHTALLVSGGEPTVWKESLIELLVIAKQQALKTKVFTNAMDFEVIYTLNKMKLVNEYSFDVKAAKDLSYATGIEISDEDYLSNLFTTMQNCEEHGVPFELRHTMAPNIDTEAVKQLLSGAEEKGIKVHYQKYVEYHKEN
jgi:pyruvate formate lyase activating enzyme